MTAVDICAQVQEWALAEVQAQCLGEDYGVATTWMPAGVQAPDGVHQIPAWHLLITARNPLLGQGALYHMVPIEPISAAGIVHARPTQEQVKAAVTDGLRKLRDLAASKTNGRPKVPQ